MEIIGKQNRGTYIVTISEDELARIAGFPSSYSEEFQKISRNDLLLGKKLDASTIYSNFKTLKDFPKRKKEMVKMLNDLIETVNEIKEVKFLDIEIKE